MRPARQKRCRSGSSSPPLRPSGTAPLLPSSSALSSDIGCSTASRDTSSVAAFLPSGLLRARPALSISGIGHSQSSAAAAASIYAIQQNLLHMQSLQDLLRRTSLAEMRDREVVEWLLGTEQWLRQLHQPLQAAGTRSTGPGVSGGVDGPSGSAFPCGIHGDVLSNAYRSALSELRLLVLHVLHTMPWWRVVETVAGVPHTTGNATSSGGGGGGGAAAVMRAAGSTRGAAVSRRASALQGMERAMAARHAITRWHVRLQVAFERVCLLLIDQSQQTVRGVLEVLLKPCQLRPPVRDGARRSIPSDSFIRVLNAIATRYSPVYVVELLEGCIADFMPRRRWAERRHHVACTAVLLYIALEGHTPAYNPRFGNSQSLQRAVELLKSLRVRHPSALSLGASGGPWGLQPTTGIAAAGAAGGGGTSEESGTDVGGSGSAASPASAHGPGRFPGAGGAPSLAAMLPTRGVLPSGYVSAMLMKGALMGGGPALLRQPALPRPSPFDGARASLMTDGTTTAATTTATASDTDMSDTSSARGHKAVRRAGASGGTQGLQSREGASDSSAAAGRGGRAELFLAVAAGRSNSAQAGQLSSESGAGGGAASVGGGGGGSAASALASASAAQQPAPSFLDVTVAHNNKLLSYRNDIIRLLLHRLLDVEQTLEPLDVEGSFPSAAAAASGGGGGGAGLSVMGGWTPMSTAASAAARRTVDLGNFGSPFGSPAASTRGSPATLFSAAPAFSSTLTTSSGFPSAPVRGSAATAAAAVVVSQTPTAASSTRSSPAALSPSPPALLARRASSLSLEASAVAGMGALTVDSPCAPQPLEFQFNALSGPYLRILRDCTTLVYGRLADDLRRQQVAGSCGNADWWTDILYFYLTVVTRVDRPVYLLYLAPSLALLGTEDESVGLLHKLITLVVKGSMPVEQPRSSTAGGLAGGSGGGGLGRTAMGVQPVRLRMPPPTGSSRRIVTMEERLRAAGHIFPLFHFLHSRIDEASGEGVRRRLLKWTAQELRRLGGGGGASTGSGGGGGTAGGLYSRSRLPSTRETRLALVAFAQCAAVSELMDVDVVPPPPQQPQQQQTSGTKATRESSRFTSSTASGDTSDGIAAALEPFLERYTLQCEPLAEEQLEEKEDEEEAEDADTASTSVASSASDDPGREHRHRKRGAPAPAAMPDAEPRRRRIDLRQMEYEGLLQTQLMANCPWEAWLR